MKRILALLCSVAAYLLFFAAFLCTMGFVGGMTVSKTVDNGTLTPLVVALIINVLLMSILAIQHNVMARPGFKRWWTRFVSPMCWRPRSCSYCYCGNSGRSRL